MGRTWLVIGALLASGAGCGAGSGPEGVLKQFVKAVTAKNYDEASGLLADEDSELFAKGMVGVPVPVDESIPIKVRAEQIRNGILTQLSEVADGVVVESKVDGANAYVTLKSASGVTIEWFLVEKGGSWKLKNFSKK